MRFFWLRDVQARRYSASYTARHKWGLPGVHCPRCEGTWSMAGDAYPSVDLSHLPGSEKYAARLEEDYAEFERLREQVRPLVPQGVHLWPGTKFGPMVGTAQGEVGSILLHNPWELLMRREALEHLQAEGVRGLKGIRTELRFRKKSPPELLELELLPRGWLHRDCLPSDRPPPCEKCERDGLNLPEEPILDAASLPQDLDVFRLAGFLTMIIGTERFVEAVRSLGDAQDVVFRELPLR
ncbi:double-CXXCG motif protein [Hyalangium rubrum]|uniref:Double-CXXCG motif protein n=1 Tax=Hyalangium rubrum TaxID=3103134 RepID=A0ABU5GWK5_9BACT|nr:double-CXXCG motif protein [Hyalangium sp. s54d21]MDY7225573.1 double-CXXCG motif protein [Hyalangium sp. s54d21]